MEPAFAASSWPKWLLTCLLRRCSHVVCQHVAVAALKLPDECLLDETVFVAGPTAESVHINIPMIRLWRGEGRLGRRVFYSLLDRIIEHTSTQMSHGCLA
jgi:hypothetical protein